MKKVLSIIAVFAFLCCLYGCTESDSNEDNVNPYNNSEVYYPTFPPEQLTAEAPTSQTEYYYEQPYSETQTHITHVAVQGAVIVRQDGTASFTYCKKCEACGYIESNTRINSGGTGPSKLTSSFYCPKCHNRQDIVIEHYSN